jgi:hypothetical protein
VTIRNYPDSFSQSGKTIYVKPNKFYYAFIWKLFCIAKIIFFKIIISSKTLVFRPVSFYHEEENLTNWHVIRGSKNIKVKFINDEKINAETLLKDSQNDIAFLKLERSPELAAYDLKVGDSSKVKMGDKVFTIGYPAHWVMGQNPKSTEGVVNALSGIKDDPTVFQISVQIQSGNSGGPISIKVVK